MSIRKLTCHCCALSVTTMVGGWWWHHGGRWWWHRDENCIFTASQLWPIIQLACWPQSATLVRVYIVDTPRVCLFVSLIYLDSRWLFLFGLPVHYRFQLFSKWQNKLYWSDLSSPAICATAASDNAEYFGPPGVKNYTYFSLDEKRPHLNHQSLLTGGWLSRINFWIFLPLRANGWWPTLLNGVQRFQALALHPPCRWIVGKSIERLTHRSWAGKDVHRQLGESLRYYKAPARQLFAMGSPSPLTN